MPPNFRSPVQVQTPVAVPDGLHYPGTHQGGSSHFLSMGGRQVGRRRIFVQIDTGNVLGIELDRADKVDAVKKKVQAALCVPTEQSALVCGDHILEKDLSEVRQDSPLLLTRGIYRSSSTPCLSPTVSDGFQKVKQLRNQTFEIVGGQSCSPSLKKLIKETVKAIESGVHPHPASGGLGGAYYFRNRKGENAALVKPTDEEPFAPNNPKGFVGKMLGQPGLKRSIRVGETGVREVAAYLLDHNRFASVPPTVLVKAAHPIFNVNPDNSITQREGASSVVPVSKMCSFQQFVKHDFDASDHGASRFPVSQVHRIGILDVRILNTDRHAGNILIRKHKNEDSSQLSGGAAWERSLGDDSVVLIPIDHGLCLPENLEDPYFEWLHWPQASMPFSEEELQYIASLDPSNDVELLRKELPMIRESSLRILFICTIFLQRAAAAGLTLVEIGGMMSRELCGMEEEASELESVCMLAKLQMEQDSLIGSGSFDTLSSSDEDFSGEQDQIQFDLDININRDDESWDYTDSGNGFPCGRSLRSPVNNVMSGFHCAESNFSQKSFMSPVASGNNGIHLSSFSASTPLTSPRMVVGGRPGLPSLLIMQNMHPLEENADYASSPYTPPPMRTLSSPPAFEEKQKGLTSSGSFNSVAFFSRILGVPRSMSLTSQKFRSNNYDARRAIGIRGTSAAEMTRKINEAGGDVSTPVVFSDMQDKAWSRFLEYFEELLPDVFARRKVESAKSLQRLGTSCRF